MRLFAISVLFLFFACPVCFGQTADPAVSADVPISSFEQSPSTKQVAIYDQGMSPSRSGDEAIRQKLKKKCDLIYERTPWREIEKELEAKYEFNIELSRSAMEDSFSYDELFTENITGLSAGNGLKIMLSQKNATYIIKDELLLIISLDDAENIEYFSNFFINVRPLLATIAELEKDRIGHLARLDEDAQKSRTIETARQPVGSISAESLLLDAVHTYRSDQWKRSGQGFVTISIVGGHAVVHCSQGFADGLRDFLTDLKYHISRN